MEEITITKDALRAALYDWEMDARTERTRTFFEVRSLSVDQVVDESSAHLWHLLSEKSLEAV